MIARRQFARVAPLLALLGIAVAHCGPSGETLCERADNAVCADGYGKAGLNHENDRSKCLAFVRDDKCGDRYRSLLECEIEKICWPVSLNRSPTQPCLWELQHHSRCTDPERYPYPEMERPE